MNNSVKAIRNKIKNIPVAAKASIWFVICSILQKGISFITTPVFTRLLTTAEYGTYNVFQAWYQILTVFMTLNLSYGVFNNAMMKYPDDRDRYMSSMQGLVLLNSFFYVVLYFIARAPINRCSGLTTEIFIMMFVIIVCLPAQDYWMARQRYEFKYKALVTVTLLSALLNPVISILMILYTPFKAEARMIGMMAASIIFGGGLWIYNIAKGKKLFVKSYWKYALSFNIPLIPHYLSQTVLAQSDRIMINSFFGLSEAGIYSVAYSTAMILTILNTSINSSLVPWTYQKMKNKEYKSIADTANAVVMLIAGVILLLICLAPEVIAIMGDSEYRDAVWIIPPIACSVFFMFLYNLFGNIEFYYEKNKLVMAASIVGAILNVVLNAIFIPLYGYKAAAYTTLFCYILFALCHYVVMMAICRKEIPGECIYDRKTLAFVSVGLLIFSLAVMMIYKKPFIRYILIIAIVLKNIRLRKDISWKDKT